MCISGMSRERLGRGGGNDDKERTMHEKLGQEEKIRLREKK